MKPKSGLNRKMQFAFGSAMLTLLVVGAVSYRGMIVSTDSARWVTHTHQVLESVQNLAFAVEGIESNSHGFALTGKKSYLEAYRAGKVKVAQDETAIRYLTLDNPEQQQQISVLESLIAEKIQRTETVITLDWTSPSAAATRSVSRQETGDEFLEVIGKLQREELRLLALRNAETNRRLSQNKMVLASGTVLGLLIVGLAAWSARREDSARGRVEGALGDSEEKYRMLLEGVHDYAIFMLDPLGQVVSWNAGAERIKGYTSKQTVGHNFSCFFSPEDIRRGRPEEVLRLTAAKGHHEENGVRMRRDGSQFFRQCHLHSVARCQGNTEGVFRGKPRRQPEQGV